MSASHKSESVLGQFELPGIRESLRQYKEDDAALDEAMHELVLESPNQWAGMCRGEVTIAATLSELLKLLEHEPNVPVRKLDPNSESLYLCVHNETLN
jgi:hypothetical protein